MAIGNENEDAERGRVFLISRSLSSVSGRPRSRAFLSAATKGQVSFNYRKSNERAAAPRRPRSCASTIIVEIGENISEQRGLERYLANMRGNGDREISADRSVYILRSRDLAR